MARTPGTPPWDDQTALQHFFDSRFARPFARDVNEAVERAWRMACRLRFGQVNTEHLLLGLLDDPEGPVSAALGRLDLDRAQLQRTVARAVGVGRRVTVPKTFAVTNAVGKVMQFAVYEARRLADREVGAEHVLIGLMLHRKSIAATILRNQGVTIDNARGACRYAKPLDRLRSELARVRPGAEEASAYEDIVGDVIRLCFRRELSNVEAKVRDVHGRVIRDWIAANTAPAGFWEMIRQRYGATQIIWECKNYENLGANAFHQAAYYMSQETGFAVVLCFRGEIKKRYYDHIKRIADDKDGVVLLLTDRDLKAFIHLARTGSSADEHIRLIYDRTVRLIS